LIETEVSINSRHQVHGTNRFGLEAPNRDSGGSSRSSSAARARREGDRARHGAPRPAQRSGAGHGQAARVILSRVQGRARRRRSDVEGLGRRQYIGLPRRTASSTTTGCNLSLTANPSHLEIVEPVVLGKVRVPIRDSTAPRRASRELSCRPLISRDAAFAGQGVSAECFGSTGLRGHRTGGSVSLHRQHQDRIPHTLAGYLAFVALPSDVAKLILGADLPCELRRPERCVSPAQVATEFRQNSEARRHRPVLLPRFGHNEGDEALVHPAADVPPSGRIDHSEIYAKKPSPRAFSPGEGQMRADCAPVRRRGGGESGYKGQRADWLDGRWADIKRRATTTSAARNNRGRSRRAH